MVRLKNPAGKMYVFKEVYIQFPSATHLQLCWVATLNTIIAINAESHYLYKSDCILEDCGSDWVKFVSKNDIYKLRFGTEIAKANFLSYASRTMNEPEIVVPPAPHSSPTSLLVSTPSSSETPSPASLSKMPSPPPKTPSLAISSLSSE